MKWITHQTGAVIAAMSLAFPVTGIAAACAGAILPDMVDQKISQLAPGKRARQKLFNKIHRGASHWYGWWLALFICALFLPLPPPVADVCAGIAFGALTHVLLDMLTPRGVPFWPFGSSTKLALPMCSTGKLSEYIFLALMLIAGAFFLKDSCLPYLQNIFS